ncbi:MAG: hypothetical protein FJ125_03620, partial [Deltaproteobacteria bacterium]|nr:hypothetical protein [Deltaproteobacteria bacterium]
MPAQVSAASGRSWSRVARPDLLTGALLALLLVWAAGGGCAADEPAAGAPAPLPDAGLLDGGAAAEDAAAADGGSHGPRDLGHWPDLAPYRERRPALARLTPATGRAGGGERVVLEGSGFVHARQVRFGGAPVASFQVQGPERIRVVTAAHAVGVVDVEVLTDEGLAVLVDGFCYVHPLRLDGIEPGAVPVTGGRRARLSGSGFQWGIEVLVGEGRAWDVQIVDDALATVLLPPNPAGWADVWAFAGGESALLRRALLYQELPRIDAVRPPAGPLAGGTPVEISGTGLGPEPELAVGGRVASAASASADGSLLRFVAPPGGAPGPVDLLVRTAAGEALLPGGYVYLGGSPVPVLHAVVPDRGPAAGGNAVLVVGERLDAGAATLLFGDVAAECRSLDGQQLACTAPPHPPGPVDVVLRLEGVGIWRLPGGYRYLGGLTLRRVEPSVGPEQGGLAAELDGEGFAAGQADVYFGPQRARGVRVHPGGRRISCVVPAGTAGTVDVVVVQGPERAALPAAFTYAGRLRLLALDPPQGSIAGGTYVRAVGTGLRPGLTFLVGTQLAQEVVWHSSTLIAFRTPPVEEEGPVDVQIPGEAILPGAYTYYDPFARGGGVWGEPVEGAMNVAVFDSYSGDPIAGATVILGPDPATPWQGATEERGLVTISGPGLTGPVDVHAGAAGYEPGSLIHTNGCNATFYLVPLEPPPTTGGPGEIEEVDGTITGILSGLEKYIPQPQEPPWRRVAYVETTWEGIYGGNPDPGPGGTLLEDGPYSITARPGDLAVVAVGGLHNEETDEFVPLRLGVHRYLFMPIGGALDGADVVLDVRLDRRIGIRLVAPPYDFEQGPDGLSLRPWLELQPEGYYHPRNEVKGSNREFWLEHLPGAGHPSLDGVQLHFE